MIPFNVPPCVGNEEKYIAQAIANHKYAEMANLQKSVMQNWNR